MFLQMYKNWESSGTFARGIAAVSLRAAEKAARNFERKARCSARAQSKNRKKGIPALSEEIDEGYQRAD